MSKRVQVPRGDNPRNECCRWSAHAIEDPRFVAAIASNIRKGDPVNLRILGLGIAFGASLLLASEARADSIIETTSSWDGSLSVSYFGEPDTATYGQTFIAPGGNLNSFTFYVNDNLDPDFVEFKAYVMAWDVGTQMVTGPILFQSGALSTTNNGGADGFETFTVNTGGVALTTGNSYAAFFSVSDLFDGSLGTSNWGIIYPADIYAGGQFVFYNNGNNFGLLTAGAWDTFGPADLAFQMSFGDTQAVPEPATIALFAFGALGLARKRRAKKSAA